MSESFFRIVTCTTNGACWEAVTWMGDPRAGVKDSLAPFRVGDSHDKKRSIFRKIRPERTHRRGKLQSLRTRKTERLCYEKINCDPYAKRTAGRVAATPALQSNPVGPASRTPQGRARRPLEYPHLAVPRAHGANPRRRFCRALCRNCPASHLNLLPSQLPCIIKSTPTPSSSNRFTTICGSNIPNGSSPMANAPRVILTSRASWKCSIL